MAHASKQATCIVATRHINFHHCKLQPFWPKTNNKLSTKRRKKNPFIIVGKNPRSQKMEFSQSHRVEMISMAVALVAIVGGTAYYYYVTKKPKGFAFVFFFSVLDFFSLPPINWFLSKGVELFVLVSFDMGPKTIACGCAKMICR